MSALREKLVYFGFRATASCITCRRTYALPSKVTSAESGSQETAQFVFVNRVLFTIIYLWKVTTASSDMEPIFFDERHFRKPCSFSWEQPERLINNLYRTAR
jgi:hypothetical protein